MTAQFVPAPPRILVAEDDAEMRSVVVDSLRKDGYEVSEVSDGGRLLVTLAREYLPGPDTRRIDLLVSDVRMPVCNGLQILEQLRAAQWRFPVILMTAFGDEVMRAHARSLCALLLDKPFEMRDLRAAVACFLKRER